MKKIYTHPQSIIVDIELGSIIATSSELLQITDTPGTFDAPIKRRTSDWEEYDGVSH